MLRFFQRAGALMPAPPATSAGPTDPSQAYLLAYLDLWYAPSPSRPLQLEQLLRL